MTTVAFNGALPTLSLPANASLDDMRLSTPDVSTMRLVWAIWAVLAIIPILMVCVIVAAAMKRKSGLNLYLAAMALPDATNNILLIVISILGSVQGTYPGAFLCHL